MPTFTENSVLQNGALNVVGLTPFEVVWTYTAEKYSALANNDVINIFEFPRNAYLVFPGDFQVTAEGDLDTNGSPAWQFDLQVDDDINGGSPTVLISNSQAGRADGDTDLLDSSATKFRAVGEQYLQIKVDALPATAGEGARLVFRGYLVRSLGTSQA